MQTTSKLPNTGTSIFAVMSAIATKFDAINLAQGFPDFSPSTTLMRLVNEAMIAGHNQYAPMPGVMALRERLSDKIKELYGGYYDPASEITVTAGATQGIYTALTALVQKGDEVIVIEPAYDSYVPAIKLNGGVPIFVKLRAPSFTVDWDEIKSKVSSKTRLILFNTPHNPTGVLWSAADLLVLEELVEEHNLFVISDEVYEHLVFDGQTHESVAKYPRLKNRSIACYSFGKVFHSTGWKMGYCTAPKYLMDEFRKIHQFMVFSCHSPTQYALAEFLQNPDEYLSLNAFFQNKRDVLTAAFGDSKFSYKPTEGTYFQLLNYDNISDLGDFDFCVHLAENHGVAAIPISSFYHDKHDDHFIRLCFAKADRVIESAAKRLASV